MTEMELADILTEVYENALDGEKVAIIHLFGIKYADIINVEGYRISGIVNNSLLNSSFATEVSKGVKLAKYVIPKG